MIGVVAKKSPNWEAIKAEYLRGVTAPELAQRFKVNLATLKSKASREKWGRDRNEVATIVQLETPRKIADVVLSEVEAITRKHFELWGKALAKAEAMLDGQSTILDKEGNVFQVPTIDAAKDLKEWASAVKAATEGQRLAAAIPDPNKAVKADPNAAQDDDEEGIRHGVLVLPMKDELPPPPAAEDQEEEDGD